MKARAVLPGNRGHHAIQVYASDETLCESIADFLADGLAAAQPTIVIATPARCDLVVKALGTRRFDIAMLLEARMLLLLDAEEMLGQLMVNGRPDAARFKEIVGLSLGRVVHPADERIVRVYGELADVLWRSGNSDAALKLETLWNDLMQTYSFALMCGYAMAGFLRDPAHEQACACHTHVHVPAVA